MARRNINDIQIDSHPTKPKATRRPEINRGRHIHFADIHAHILPGVGDGPADMAETLEMIRIAYEEGIRTLICTPHYIPGRSNMSADELRKIFNDTAAKVKKLYPEFCLALGHEIYYEDSILKDLKSGEALTIGDTNFCLIEFKATISYETIFQAVRNLTAGGYRPIIAHIERYDCLYRQEERLRLLIQSGAYTQMNYESIPGNMFDHRKFYCLKMIEDGLVHFLGTNGHGTEKLNIQPAIQILDKKINPRRINKIILENGQKMLDNLNI